jgi:pimeloyl-ACP methyl ester carboxylesterase
MKTKLTILLAFLVMTTAMAQQEMETINFPAKDGVAVTADYYQYHPDTVPLILLFHQAGWSRGEYLEIAPAINKLGFNCMAVDLRSGNQVNGVVNQTKVSAVSKMKPTQYLDAYQDMEAATKYARETLGIAEVILWGSSYSAALVLNYGGQYPELVSGILAFSPGEYFRSAGKSDQFIQESARNITSPVFITSAKSEKQAWWEIYQSIPGESKSFFIPETNGNHGSRALFKEFTDSKAYWAAVETFLSSLK